MNKADPRLLCLADEVSRVACLLRMGEAGLEIVSGTPGAAAKITLVLKDLRAKGVHVREERLGPKTIDVDFVKIEPGDPRYLDASAREFRVRGWQARVRSRIKAETWRLLLTLPIAPESREATLSDLDRVDDGAAEKLLEHLKDAKRELAALV